jgi:acetate kinase
MKKILILNAGSSSIKFDLFYATTLEPLIRGSVDQIGEGKKSRIKYTQQGNATKEEETIKSHANALEKIIQILNNTKSLKDASELLLVGHRVVHGGTEFTEPTLINDEVLGKIEHLSDLAPLHNPHAVSGIKEATRLFKGVPQVAVFDTSFHMTLPPKAYRYALPKTISPKIRKYGFHGISHQYIVSKAAETLGRKLTHFKLISLHLGNGCSACAILNGKSIDTTMGLTPLEGLMMGTRAGDMDPSVLLHMMRANNESISPQEAEHILNYESGLKGLTGFNDMRSVQEEVEKGNPDAKLAFDIFVYRIQKYIGAYFVALNGADAIAFTAGIGENSTMVRKNVCQNLGCLGAWLDEAKNEKVNLDDPKTWEINTDDSPVKIVVIPTREELEMAMMAKEIYEYSKEAQVI